MDIKLNLSVLDFFVFILCTFLTYVFVFWGNKKKAKNEDHFLDLLLMGRKLTLPLFTATLVATWYGGIFGVSKIAFESGLYNFYTQGLFWYLTYLIFAVFLAQRIRKTEAATLPELVGMKFGKKAEKIAAVFNIINLLPIAYIISIGLFINLLFPINYPLAMLIGLIFVVGYSLNGGFRSVVYSDLFQFAIMTTAVILVLIVSTISFGIAPLESLPANYYSFTGKSTLLETLSWGLIAFGTLVDPNFYQRCFAANSTQTAKKGIYLATVIWIIFDLSLTFGAMYAKALMPQADAKWGYILYAVDILPAGLKGFFLAGICATILSTLDSYLFLAGTTLSYDLQKNQKLKQKYGIIIIAMISFLMALVFDGNIKSVWKTLGGLSTSALLAPMLWSYFARVKVPSNQFITAMIAGASFCTLWNIYNLIYQSHLDGIYIGIIASVTVLLIPKRLFIS